MGAKVEGESYRLGYYATGDLNVDANGWRSSCYDEKTSNGLLYNGFMTKPTTAYSEYDKDMLKRTMLEHEAIFRKQVSCGTGPKTKSRALALDRPAMPPPRL